MAGIREKNSVVVGCYGPTAASSHVEKIDRAAVEVSLSTSSGLSSPDDIKCGYLLRQTLETVLCTTLHPRCSIQIQVQVIQQDGPLLPTMINGACLACVDAGVAMNCLVAAVCVAVMSDGRYLLDPDIKETQSASALATFAFCSTSSDVILSDTVGPMSDTVFQEALTLAHIACSQIHNLCRAALAKKLERGV